MEECVSLKTIQKQESVEERGKRQEVAMGFQYTIQYKMLGAET